MLTPEDAQYLTEAVADLAAPLHDCLGKGYHLAHAHYDDFGMKGRGYTKGRTDLTRDHARRNLEVLAEEQALGGWKVTDSTSGRIHLRKELLRIKVLHGMPWGDTPAPGRNQARISYYRNPNLDLFGVESSNLLAVWNADPVTEEITVRLVRPVEEWKYRHRPVVDLDLVLPHSADEFGEWQFIPDDQDFTLPFVIDEDEQRDEEEGGRSGA